MRCIFCQSETFSQVEDEGRYVCDFCGVQSQEFVEEADEAVIGETVTRTLFRDRVLRADSTFSWEDVILGFQDIVKMQIEYLITKLGCHSEIAAVAKHLVHLYVRSEVPAVEKQEAKIDPLFVADAIQLPVSLVICYISCCWCKEPISAVDLSRLALHGLLPYWRAYRKLPHTSNLTGKNSPFRPNYVPTWGSIEIMTSRFVISHGLDLPSVNFPLLASRYSLELGLPEVLVPIAIRIQRLCDPDLLSPIPNLNLNNPHVHTLSIFLAAIMIIFDFGEREEAAEGVEWGGMSLGKTVKIVFERSRGGVLPIGAGDTRRFPTSAVSPFANFATETSSIQNEKSEYLSAVLPDKTLSASLTDNYLAGTFKCLTKRDKILRLAVAASAETLLHLGPVEAIRKIFGSGEIPTESFCSPPADEQRPGRIFLFNYPNDLKRSDSYVLLRHSLAQHIAVLDRQLHAGVIQIFKVLTDVGLAQSLSARLGNFVQPDLVSNSKRDNPPSKRRRKSDTPQTATRKSPRNLRGSTTEERGNKAGKYPVGSTNKWFLAEDYTPRRSRQISSILEDETSEEKMDENSDENIGAETEQMPMRECEIPGFDEDTEIIDNTPAENNPKHRSKRDDFCPICDRKSKVLIPGPWGEAVCGKCCFEIRKKSRI